MYLIFTTEQEAVRLEAKISKSMGLPKGNTLNYAKIIKHVSEDRWAIRINNGGDSRITDAERNKKTELTPDWFPTPDEL